MAALTYAHTIAEPDLPSSQETGYEIPAEVHTDDIVHAVAFDAAPYFSRFDDSELSDVVQKLATIDFARDYAADEVADYFDNEDGYEPVTDLFAYIADQEPNKFELIGYEVSLSGQDVFAWLKENRPDAFIRLGAQSPELIEEYDRDALPSVEP